MSFFIGTDIGSTHIRHVLYCPKEDKFLGFTMKTFEEFNEFTEEIYQNIVLPIYELCKANGVKLSKLSKIGISLAANSNKKSGVILKWGSHGNWEGFNLISCLQQYFNAAIIIEDDANCAAVYERSIIDKNMDSLIYITISTGIGCGIIIKGQLYTGPNTFAGELGHIKIFGNSRRCSCGEYGCLQSILSGDGIRDSLIKKHEEHSIRINAAKKLEDVISNGKSKKEIIRLVLYEKANLMKGVLITLKRLFGINQFIIGGGVINGMPDFFSIIQNITEEYDPFIRIVRASDSKYNGALGAIQLIKIQEDK